MLPRETTIPDMLIRLTLIPAILIPMNVKNTERGMESAITSVALRSFKKTNMTITAISIPIMPDSITVERLDTIVWLSSLIVLKEMEPEKRALSRSRISLIELIMLSVFSPPLFETSTRTTSLTSLMQSEKTQVITQPQSMRPGRSTPTRLQ